MSQLHSSLGRRASSSGAAYRGMAKLIAPLAHLGMLGQEAIHRPFRAEVLPASSRVA